MESLPSHIESLWISLGLSLNVFYELANNYVGAEDAPTLDQSTRGRLLRRTKLVISLRDRPDRKP